jgi:hypothetical protein
MVGDRLAPGGVEGLPGEGGLGLPVLAHQVVARAFRPIAEDGHDLVERPAAVKRRDERLHDGRGAVVRARVAPLLEEVGAVDVPVAERRRLVVEEPDVDARLRFPQRLGKLQIRRRRVNRVAAEDDQQADRARVEVAGQRLEPVDLPRGVGRERVGDDDGGADVAERVVDRVRDRVRLGRLTGADRHQATAPGRGKVLHRGADKRIERLVAERGGRAARDARQDGARDRVHLARLERQARIGNGAGRRRRRLGDVQPVHLGVRPANPAT